MTYSPLAAPSVTAQTLKEHGLVARRSLGQNFLVDDNVVGRILGMAELGGDEPVVEVGPGIGTLTIALCAASGTVVAVERDERLLPVLEKTTESCSNLRVVCADAVTVPVFRLATELGSPLALVANLPYAVAATVVLRFFEDVPSLKKAVVMVQSEVADRMTASPGSRQYGAYTVKLRLHAVAVGRFAVARTCFMPAPRVDSSVVRFERSDLLIPEPLRRVAAQLVDAGFAQRRKTLRNSLRAALDIDPTLVDAILAGAGVAGERRAETVDLEGYLQMASVAVEEGILPLSCPSC